MVLTVKTANTKPLENILLTQRIAGHYYVNALQLLAFAKLYFKAQPQLLPCDKLEDKQWWQNHTLQQRCEIEHISEYGKGSLLLPLMYYIVVHTEVTNAL